MQGVSKVFVKLIFTLILVCFISSCMVLGVCYAVFTKSTSFARNVTPADTGTEIYNLTWGATTYYIHEQITGNMYIYDGGTYSYVYSAIKNVSNFDVVLRAKAFACWVDNNDNIIKPAVLGTGKDYTSLIFIGTRTINTGTTPTYAGWILQENGYYYYNSTVKPGAYVPFCRSTGLSDTANIPSGATKMRLYYSVEVMQYTGGAYESEWTPSTSWNTNPNSSLGLNTTIDGITLTSAAYRDEAMAVLRANGTTWQEAMGTLGEDTFTESSSIIVRLGTSITSSTINYLNGTNNNAYLRLYNNSCKTMLMATRYMVQLMDSTDAINWEINNTSAWTNFTDLSPISLTLTFQDGSNWIDVRDTPGTTFDNTTSAISYVYNSIVRPTQSVGGLNATVSLSGVDSNIDEDGKIGEKYYAFRIVTTLIAIETTYTEMMSQALDYTGAYNGVFTSGQIQDFPANATTLANLKSLFLTEDSNTQTPYSAWLANILANL